MGTVIILSPGAVSCGCLLARALISAEESRGCMLIATQTKLPDPATLLLDALREETHRLSLNREEMMAQIDAPLDLKQSAYERKLSESPFLRSLPEAEIKSKRTRR